MGGVGRGGEEGGGGGEGVEGGVRLIRRHLVCFNVIERIFHVVWSF